MIDANPWLVKGRFSYYLFYCCILTFLSIALSSPCLGQVVISGSVFSSEDDSPIIGAAILHQKSGNGTITDVEGKFVLEVLQLSDTLAVSYVGYKPAIVPISNRSSISIIMDPDFKLLKGLVITGYKPQRPEDITGAVSVLDVEEMQTYQAPSFAQKLEGRVSGLHTFASGEPGSPVDIRIRGISSFTDNDPLIIIDGVPVRSRQFNWLNSYDIENIQVLKDASAASIYGARANNGVIIIETKKGEPGKAKVSYNGYAGVQKPVNTYDKFLIQDPLDYGEYLWQSQINAGETPSDDVYGSGPEPVVPDYIWPFEGEVDESSYSYPDNVIIQANKEGTNWSNETTRPALITEHNLRVSGGSDQGRYNFSFGYFKQEGTLKYNWLDRYTFRINSETKAGMFTFGENFTLARTQHVEQNVNLPQGSIYEHLSIVPIYDIGGNFAENDKWKLHPFANLYRNKDNKRSTSYVLGNIYAEANFLDFLKLRTSLGINYAEGTSLNFNHAIPNISNRQTNDFSEQWSKQHGYTWTNSLIFNKTFSRHSLDALLGYELIHEQSRNIGGSLIGYLATDPNLWYINPNLANPDTRQVGSSGDISRLASLFGKIDYQFDRRYLLSFTIRHDGSSKFGIDKYGTFPSGSFGWRLSEESFLKDNSWLTDLKLRGGLGITGGQNIPSGNAHNQFGGSNVGFVWAGYNLSGDNKTLEHGIALSKYGNALTRWERNWSINVGVDFAAFDNKLDVIADVYHRVVDGLLFNAAIPGTTGWSEPPFVNVAEMENRGFDISLGYKSNSGKFKYALRLNATHYSNKINKVQGESDEFFSDHFTALIGTMNINKVGHPISGFYGFTADGIFRDQQEVDEHVVQEGKQPGRIRFANIDSLLVINDDDKSFIGHPHPDLILGLNISMEFKGFDFSVFFNSWLGNDIYNVTKYYFEQNGRINSNKSAEVLTNSWRPDNPDGTIPQIDKGDIYSKNSSSYYLEDGSYLRLRQLQIGYSFPGLSSRSVISNMRVYIQAQNLLTITNYSGLDPAVPFQEDYSSNEVRDLFTGYDFGFYPVSKSFTIGVNLSF